MQSQSHSAAGSVCSQSAKARHRLDAAFDQTSFATVTRNFGNWSTSPFFLAVSPINATTRTTSYYGDKLITERLLSSTLNATNGLYTLTWTSDPSAFIELGPTVMSNYTTILRLYRDDYDVNAGTTYGQYLCVNVTEPNIALGQFAGRAAADIFHFGEIIRASTTLGRRVERQFTAAAGPTSRI